jgi:hypothetical protein
VQTHYLEAAAPDYLQTAVETAVNIHREDLPGDILIFLTGQDECEAGGCFMGPAGRCWVLHDMSTRPAFLHVGALVRAGGCGGGAGDWHSQVCCHDVAAGSCLVLATQALAAC